MNVIGILRVLLQEINIAKKGKREEYPVLRVTYLLGKTWFAHTLRALLNRACGLRLDNSDNVLFSKPGFLKIDFML